MHDGGSIQFFGLLSWNVVGPIHLIEKVLDARGCVNILSYVMFSYADESFKMIMIPNIPPDCRESG